LRVSRIDAVLALALGRLFHSLGPGVWSRLASLRPDFCGELYGDAQWGRCDLD